VQVQKETQNVTGIPGTQMAGGENPAESAGHGSSVVFVEILEVVGDAPQTKVFVPEQQQHKANSTNLNSSVRTTPYRNRLYPGPTTGATDLRSVT